METLWHTTNIYLHPNIHEFAEKLTSKLPGDLKVQYIYASLSHLYFQVVYFTNSGSEANDLAVTMAQLYTGAHDVINLR